MKSLFLMLLLASATAAAYAGETVIRGTLLGSNGKPMIKADVHLGNLNSRRVAVATAGPDGAFTFTTASRGAVNVEFSGVGHVAKTVTLLLTGAAKALEINVRLEANVRPRTVDSVLIIGDFNEFDFSSGVKMTPKPDGKFRAEFDESPDNFRYQVLVYGGKVGGEGLHSINGTQADSYVYDGGGDYRSVLNAAKGRRTVIFDPAMMPAESAAASIDINDAWQKKFARIQEQSKERQATVQRHAAAFFAEGGKDFRFNPDELRGGLINDIAAETDADLRSLLMMSYMEIPYSTAPDDRSRKMAADLLGNVPHGSPLWYDKSLALVAVSMTGTPEKYEQYLLDMHKAGDTNAVPWAFMRVLSEAKGLGRAADIAPMYDLMKKHFSSSRAFSSAKRQYDPSKAVEIGKNVPDFSFVSVENPERQITNADIKGKYALIDLWAVWCGPCRGELPHLHDVYEKFKGKNFEILSVSFDQKVADVAKFRGDKWKMPWMHAFSEGVFNSKAADIFEVAGIPKPILVSPDGVIMAMDSDLRGEKLEQTLTKYLGR